MQDLKTTIIEAIKQAKKNKFYLTNKTIEEIVTKAVDEFYASPSALPVSNEE